MQHDLRMQEQYKGSLDIGQEDVGQKDAAGQKDLKREFTLCVKKFTSRS